MRTHSFKLLALTALLAIFAVACADDGGGTNADGSSADGTSTPDMTIAPGGFVVEPTDSLQEFPDCFNDCDHAGPLFTFQWESQEGVSGIIDGGCHTWPNGTEGGDIDVIALLAPPRTMLEVVVEPSEGSLLDPVIYSHAGTSGPGMTYNDARAEGDRAARLTFAAPYAQGVPFYVIIEHAPNYFLFEPDVGLCSRVEGGSDYGYNMTVREIPFEVTELGDLTVGGSASASGTLTAGGEVQYFRFTAPADAPAVNVTVSPTGSSSFGPVAAGMDTNGGLLVWGPLVHNNGASSPISLSAMNFDVCGPDCTGTGEYIFAVLDWEGVAWPGVFSFDVDVNL